MRTTTINGTPVVSSDHRGERAPQTTTEATAMTEVYRNRTGTRRIYGTDYPIETIVWRKGPRQWVLWINQCNGACDYCNTYRTRREALTNAR